MGSWLLAAKPLPQRDKRDERPGSYCSRSCAGCGSGPVVRGDLGKFALQGAFPGTQRRGRCLRSNCCARS
jgi:hypothetical protein